MKSHRVVMLVALLAQSALVADRYPYFFSKYTPKEFELTADPDAPQWRGVPAVYADKGPMREPVALRSEFRSRWTKDNLYVLFICQYDQLYLKPSPSVKEETNKLWDWDVAEIFIGTDFDNIQQYKEFEVSPQGEWVDLDIDRSNPKPEGGWLWNSGVQVKSRIDENKHFWYGEMRIPLAALGVVKPKQGMEMRVNLYRCQGPPQGRKYIAWQPTGQKTFHVPDAFGHMMLTK